MSKSKLQLRNKAEPKKGGQQATHGLMRRGGGVYEEYRELVARARGEIEAVDDTLARVEVVLRFVTDCTLLTAEGRGNRPLNQELRDFAKVIDKLVPKARLYAAEQIVLGNRTPSKPRTKAGGGEIREVDEGSAPALKRKK